MKLADRDRIKLPSSEALRITYPDPSRTRFVITLIADPGPI